MNIIMKLTQQGHQNGLKGIRNTLATIPYQTNGATVVSPAEVYGVLYKMLEQQKNTMGLPASLPSCMDRTTWDDIVTLLDSVDELLCSKLNTFNSLSTAQQTALVKQCLSEPESWMHLYDVLRAMSRLGCAPLDFYHLGNTVMNA